MPIGVISRNQIFKYGVVRACLDHGMTIHAHQDDTPQLLQSLGINDVILWHFTADDTSPQDDIRALASEHPETKIVALAPNALCFTLEADCGEILAATIPETTCSDAIIGVLLLAEQGFQVSRPAVAPLAVHFPPLDHAPPVTLGNAMLPMPPPAMAGRESPVLLSQREAAVLSYLSAGYSNKLIARALGVCDATVKAHLRSSFRRIGVTNRTQAALWASKNL